MSRADDETRADLVADFRGRVEGLLRDGVPAYPPLGGRTPWAEAPEAEKLEQIVWESMSVWLGAGSSGAGAAGPRVIAVPGAIALELVERHVDYGGLPAAQRGLLEGLRAGLDAGRFDGAAPDRKDLIATGLARAVGIGHLEGMLAAWKEDGDRPWAGRPEAEKVRVLVDHAPETDAPGAYTLAVIGREVDIAGLPPWRREALEGLRARIDGGEFDGAGRGPLDPDDRLDRALRLAELEARVEDEKRFGAPDRHGKRRPWDGLTEEQKLGEIELEIGELRLGTEPKAYEVITREVDLARVPEDRRRDFEEGREEAGLESLPSPAEPVRPRSTAMADSRKGRAMDDLVADFGASIDALWREGKTFPGSNSPERLKLESIVHEGWWTSVLVGQAVRAGAVLEAVERHVDYAGLPAAQREMLEGLRARVDAGEIGIEQPGHKDLLGMGLERVVGVGTFDEMLQAAKGGRDWPWGEDWPWEERPEAEKVKAIVDMAAGGAFGPPGAYTLAAIEREVDYAKLPEWRREALQVLRDRLDHGELDGENPNPLYQGDRAERALRLAELEARVEDDKRLGIPEVVGNRPWREFTEEEKYDLIKAEIHELRLESEAPAFDVIAREVDLARLPGEARREFEEGRAGAEWIGERGASDVPPRVQRQRSSVAERERRAIAAYEAAVAEVVRPGPEAPSEGADTRHPEADRGGLGLLADLAVDHGVEQEVFVRTARRVMGWPEPTAEQRQWMADAWAYAEGVGMPGPDALRELHAGWTRDYALRSMPDFRADAFEALMTRLEAFGDEFARLARTEEQRALAGKFGDFVGEANGTIADLAGPQAAERLASPGEIAAGHDGTAAVPAPGRGEYQVWHDTAWPENTIHDIRAGALASDFPGDFAQVATVRADGLREALPRSPGAIARDADGAELRRPERDDGRGR